MRYILPLLLTLTTALTTFWYGNYTQKYHSLFLIAILDMFCFLIIAVFAYFWEGPGLAMSKLKAGIFEPYIIPYISLTIVYGCLWYFLTSQKGAAYTSVYESSYILILILLGAFFNQEKLDLKFFLGSFLVCIGIIIIEIE